MPGKVLSAYLLVKVFPIILSHQSKQREEGPTKSVKAGVIIVRVASKSHASVALGTLPATKRESVKKSSLPYSHCTLGNVNPETAASHKDYIHSILYPVF